jgi:hypothetical protein
MPPLRSLPSRLSPRESKDSRGKHRLARKSKEIAVPKLDDLLRVAAHKSCARPAITHRWAVGPRAPGCARCPAAHASRLTKSALVPQEATMDEIYFAVPLAADAVRVASSCNSSIHSAS